MRLTIEKSRLVQCVSLISKGMSSHSTIPVLSGIHINAATDGVIFETSDLEISVRHIEDAMIERTGATVVSGRLFTDIVKSLPEAAVTLETKDDKLNISAQETLFSIATMSAEDFPQFPTIIATRSVQLKVEQLTKMVKKVIRAVSRDVSRAVLTGIFFKVGKTDTMMVATDSYRLAITSATQTKAEDKGEDKEDFELIVPGTLLDEVCRTAADEEKITIGESENQIIIIFGSTTFIARKIEGNYPNYNQIIPTQKNLTATIETELLLGAVRRVSIVAKNSSPIRLVFHNDAQLLEVTAQTQDIGQASESIPAQIDGEGFEIGFNHQYILDGLAVVDTEEITFEAQTPLKPGIFKTVDASTDTSSYFYLTMPVRLER
ncbi:MAG: DNA polymerase III subunit beta [Coriobacteriales bacterium]|jgi:DNA polymerase-3 subunit beta|nr:DNA polymerase III subunit beta [Coriobacteriales bacterium]